MLDSSVRRNWTDRQFQHSVVQLDCSPFKDHQLGLSLEQFGKWTKKSAPEVVNPSNLLGR
jgi:hypothetical protein